MAVYMIKGNGMYHLWKCFCDGFWFRWVRGKQNEMTVAQFAKRLKAGEKWTVK